jgi:hypothetical protein
LVDAKDESGASIEWKLTEASYSDAIGWIVREAVARIPKVVEIDAEKIDVLDHVDQDAGELLRLEPLQVVGKRCAVSGRVIAYEPDGRVCPQCERVYYKTKVPETCACGRSIGNLRSKAADGAADAVDEADAKNASSSAGADAVATT